MTFNDLEIKLFEVILSALGLALTGLIGVWIAKLQAGVKREYGEQAAIKAMQYLDILDGAAMNAVVTMKQSVVDALKKDRLWTPEAAEKVKGDAVRLAVDSLGALRTNIEKQLLIDVPKWLEGAIEVQLLNLKQDEAGGGGAPPQN